MLVEEFRSGGATQAEFCRKRGLNDRTFNGWLRKARDARPAFVRVELPAAVPGWTVELALADGVRVRIEGCADAGVAAALVRGIVR
jgi:transposase-like protein